MVSDDPLLGVGICPVDGEVVLFNQPGRVSEMLDPGLPVNDPPPCPKHGEALEDPGTDAEVLRAAAQRLGRDHRAVFVRAVD
jgi:hypothetical protein